MRYCIRSEVLTDVYVRFCTGEGWCYGAVETGDYEFGRKGGIKPVAEHAADAYVAADKLGEM